MSGSAVASLVTGQRTAPAGTPLLVYAGDLPVADTSRCWRRRRGKRGRLWHRRCRGGTRCGRRLPGGGRRSGGASTELRGGPAMRLEEALLGRAQGVRLDLWVPASTPCTYTVSVRQPSAHAHAQRLTSALLAPICALHPTFATVRCDSQAPQGRPPRGATPDDRGPRPRVGSRAGSGQRRGPGPAGGVGTEGPGRRGRRHAGGIGGGGAIGEREGTLNERPSECQLPWEGASGGGVQTS